jgi:hypothetical protein
MFTRGSGSGVTSRRIITGDPRVAPHPDRVSRHPVDRRRTSQAARSARSATSLGPPRPPAAAALARPTPRTGQAVDVRSSGGSAAFTPGTPAVAALPRPGSAVHLLPRRTALTAGSPGSPTRAAPTRPGRGHPKPQQAESYSWATAPRYGQHDHVMQLGPPSTPATTTRPSRTRSTPRPSRRWAVSWKPLVKSNASAVTITTTTITVRSTSPS